MAHPREFAAPVAAARMARNSVAEDVEMELTPVPQEVSATLVARFTMSQPDLS